MLNISFGAGAVRAPSHYASGYTKMIQLRLRYASFSHFLVIK
jgi:hypothetical protein